ncbi:hypothetical protein HKCCE4037_01615 [Rhodobacterales bacterium HKCCE4037]|nr:hypothetical protein [Rhodobacterales bacterium HKCCE4037]
MSGFPGLETGVDGAAVFLPDSCRETLQGIRDLGAETLTLLIEDDELDEIFYSEVERIADEVNLGIERFPIVDFAVPSDGAATEWLERAQERARRRSAGATTAFACQYGAGRSGLMASWLLIEGGMSPAEAISLVRSHFSDAVESEAQETWLQGLN